MIIAVIFTGGCLKESLDDCPENGYNLYFYYPANGDTDVFSSFINNVNLYIYDSDGYLVSDLDISSEDLAKHQGLYGVELDLPDGKYSVVAWGNVAGYTTITGEGNVLSGRAKQYQYVNEEIVSDCDSLYFGRTIIDFVSGTLKTDTLEFVSAHINMEVHIAGYDNIPASKESGQGIIGLDNVPVGYDFSMDVTGEVSQMYPVWSVDGNEEVLFSRFRTFRFPDNTDIVLHVYAPGGRVVAEVILSDFIEENGISIEDTNEITVPIYILFSNGGFYVTVDGWADIPVDPIIPAP